VSEACRLLITLSQPPFGFGGVKYWLTDFHILCVVIWLDLWLESTVRKHVTVAQEKKSEWTSC